MANEMVLTQVPLSDLLERIRELIREEIQEAAASNSNEPGYLTKSQVAELLGVRLLTITTWVKQGRLKAYRVGRRVYFKQQDVEQALKKINIG